MIRPKISQLLFVFAILFPNAMAVDKGKVGEECCTGIWGVDVPIAAKLMKATVLDETFKTDYEAYIENYFMKLNQVEDDYEGHCFGLLNYICIGPPNPPQQCQCNDKPPFKSYENKNNFCAMDLGSFCHEHYHDCGAGLECMPSSKYVGLNECVEHSNPTEREKLGKDALGYVEGGTGNGNGGGNGGGSGGSESDGSGYIKSSWLLSSSAFAITLAVAQHFML